MFMFVHSFIQFFSLIGFTIENVWKRMKIDWETSKKIVYQSMLHAGGAFKMKYLSSNCNWVHENIQAFVWNLWENRINNKISVCISVLLKHVHISFALMGVYSTETQCAFKMFYSILNTLSVVRCKLSFLFSCTQL